MLAALKAAATKVRAPVDTHSTSELAYHHQQSPPAGFKSNNHRPTKINKAHDHRLLPVLTQQHYGNHNHHQKQQSINRTTTQQTKANQTSIKTTSLPPTALMPWMMTPSRTSNRPLCNRPVTTLL